MDVYVVTTGEYDDYRIAQVFRNEDDAKRMVEMLGTDADVEVMPLRDSKWTPGRYMMQTTTVDLAGNIVGQHETTRIDAADGYRGTARSNTQAVGGTYRAWTYGDAERVPQVHAAAVDQIRAQLNEL